MDDPLGYKPGSSTGERVLPHQLLRRVLFANHLARYRFAAGLRGPGDLLDLGCGTGYGTQLLAARGHRCTGIDIAEEAVEYARARHAHPNARFVVGDVREAGFEAASQDMVVCFEVIEHVEGPEQVLAEAARLLRPGGLLVISSPNARKSEWADGKPVNPFHLTEFTQEELGDLVGRSGFGHFEWAGQTNGEATRRMNRGARAIGARMARLHDDPGYWPPRWERRLHGLASQVVARTTWSAVERENVVRPGVVDDADVLVLVART